MGENVIDYYINGFVSNGFIITNLYYYLDITSLIKLIHTNKLQYKKRKVIYSIIISYVYKNLKMHCIYKNLKIHRKNIKPILNEIYGYINKKDYLCIIHKNNKYKLFDNLYYIIDYKEYYKFIDNLCETNHYLNKKIESIKQNKPLFN